MAAGKTASDPRSKISLYARELEELCGSQTPEDQFWSEFLYRVLAAMGATAGGIWKIDPSTRLKCEAEIGLKELGYQTGDVKGRNDELLTRVVGRGEPLLCDASSDGDARLPTQHAYTLAPILQGERCVGAVEVIHPPSLPKHVHSGLLQFLEQMCGLASRYLSSNEQPEARIPLETAEFWQRLERLALALHGASKTSSICYTGANDIREVLGVNRASIAVVDKHSRIRVRAVSGKESVNRRSNVIRKLEKLLAALLPTGKPFAFNGEGHELAPQIQEPLLEYVEESGVRMFLFIPFLPPAATVGDNEGAGRVAARLVPIGGLVIEQFADSRSRPDLEAACELIGAHLATALHNSMQRERIFLYWLWVTLGHCRDALTARRSRELLLAIALIGGVVAYAAVTPFDYRVTAEGALMPVEQSKVFAPEDAVVEAIRVKGGQRVQAGEVLVVLSSDAVEERLASATSELKQLRKERLALRDRLKTTTGDDRIAISQRLAEVDIDVPRLSDELKRLGGRKSKLAVRAPIDGVVATFQVRQRLQNRTVNRGEVLLEVMNDRGTWHLELDVPEKRMGHLIDARTRDKHPRAEFFLRTDPDREFRGRLASVSTRAEVAADEGAVVPVLVSFDHKEIDHLNIGAEVRCKIDCGKKPLGYVLFGDVIDFVRTYFWF